MIFFPVKNYDDMMGGKIKTQDQFGNVNNLKMSPTQSYNFVPLSTKNLISQSFTKVDIFIFYIKLLTLYNTNS